MQLRTLGTLELTNSKLDRPKPLLLLSYLSVEGSKERRDLSELFHIESNNPMAALRVTLSRIKKDAEHAVDIHEKRVAINISSDAAELLSASEESNYQKVIELYTGPFLEGFFLKDCPVELEEWVYQSREFIAAQVRQAYLIKAEQEAKQENFAEATKLAEKAFKLTGAPDPSPQELEQLYSLLLLSDSFEQNAVRKLASDYGFELSETKEEALARYQTANTNSKTNLQLRNNLFVGRKEEISQIRDLLDQQNYRLLSLYGQGGVGKTRLAMHTAISYLEEQKQFKDGIYLVELEALEHESQIPSQIAKSLNLTLNETDPSEQLSKQIADKHMLLLLDNYEHLLSSLPLCSKLLSHCPNLKLLVTSRERLNIAEEIALEINGLKVPLRGNLSPQEALEYAIIKLWQDRAKHAKHNYQLTEEGVTDVIMIAQLVEGLPLGIELAAAGINMMSANEIANAISQDIDTLYTPDRDTKDRHQSLRATFEYSWNLLTSKEQEVLQHLSIFAGGFTRQAANQVANADIPTLRTLADKSLIKISSNFRFSLHTLLWQFTQEKFDQNPTNKSQIQENHANYYSNYAQEAEPHLITKNQLEYLRKLDVEKDNVRKALLFNLNNNPVEALKQAAALRRFWEKRGYLTEGRAWLFDVVKKLEGNESDAYLKAVYALGVLTHRQKGLSEAEQYFKQSEKLARQKNNTQMLADSINYLAGVAWGQNDFENAAKLLNESIELKRTLGDERGVAVSLGNLGMLARNQDKFEQAQTFYKESLAIFKQIDDRSQFAKLLKQLGSLAKLQGNSSEAKLWLQQSLELFQEQKDKRNEAETFSELGYTLCISGELESAMQAFQTSLRIAKKCEAVTEEIDALQGLALASYLTSDYEVSQRHFIAVLEKADEQKQNGFIASALEGLACNQAALKKYEKAALTWGALEIKASPMAEGIKKLFPKRYQAAFDLTVKKLGKVEFTRLLTQGKTINLEGLLQLLE